MHLLVDLENVQPTAAAVAGWMGATGKAWIFYGANQLKLLPAFRALGDRVTLVPISRPGANSLDFHLVFYLGHLAAKSPTSAFTVLSKDKGYDPAIKHAQMLDFAVRRVAALPPVAKTKPLTTGKKPASAPAAKKATPARPAAPKLRALAAPKKVARKVAPKPAVAPVARKVALARPGRAKAAPATTKATPANAKAAPGQPKAASVVAKGTPAVAKATQGKGNPARAVRAPEASAKGTPVQAAAKKAAPSVYDQVLKDLQGRRRPAMLAALLRLIESKVGSSATPTQVLAILNRLKSTRAIRVVAGQLSYGID